LPDVALEQWCLDGAVVIHPRSGLVCAVTVAIEFESGTHTKFDVKGGMRARSAFLASASCSCIALCKKLKPGGQEDVAIGWTSIFTPQWTHGATPKYVQHMGKHGICLSPEELRQIKPNRSFPRPELFTQHVTCNNSCTCSVSIGHHSRCPPACIALQANGGSSSIPTLTSSGSSDEGWVDAQGTASSIEIQISSRTWSSAEATTASITDALTSQWAMRTTRCMTKTRQCGLFPGRLHWGDIFTLTTPDHFHSKIQKRFAEREMINDFPDTTAILHQATYFLAHCSTSSEPARSCRCSAAAVASAAVHGVCW
jgi:hypothetical protein